MGMGMDLGMGLGLGLNSTSPLMLNPTRPPIRNSQVYKLHSLGL